LDVGCLVEVQALGRIHPSIRPVAADSQASSGVISYILFSPFPFLLRAQTTTIFICFDQRGRYRSKEDFHI